MPRRTASGGPGHYRFQSRRKNQRRSLNMQCREFREIADSYLGNELIVETNHEVISHLEQCPECRRELAARRELRSQLRQAFIKTPENQLRPEFADHLRTQLHDYALGKSSARMVSPRGR